jgi:hypothetical protein
MRKLLSRLLILLCAFTLLNGAGVSPTIAANTVIFSDNFDDGNDDGWNQFLSTWSAATGEYVTFETEEDFYTFTGNATWSNYVFEADVKMDMWENDVGLVFYNQPGNTENIRFTISKDGDSVEPRISWMQLFGNEYDVHSELATWTNTALSLADDTWYRLRVEILGNNVYAYIDDVLFAWLVSDQEGRITSFDNVLVTTSPSDEELEPYDSFKGESIDPDKWEPDGGRNAPRDSFDLVREVSGNSLRMLNRIYAGNSTSVRVRFANSNLVTGIEIKGKVKDLELIGCGESDDRTRIQALRASGFFFKTIAPGGVSGAFVDVLASIYVERRADSEDPPGVLRVVALVYVCPDSNCGSGGEILFYEDLGEYKVGADIKLFMQWVPRYHYFIFRRDNEPEQASPFFGDRNHGPPSSPAKRLGLSHSVADCAGDPQPVAFVETRIDKVDVNESAISAP